MITGNSKFFSTSRIVYIAFIVLFLTVRLPWLLMLPMQEAPDEFAHYWVIKFLYEHWRLPGAQEVLQGGPSAIYGSLPQFGYLPHCLIAFFFPPSHLACIARLGSLFSGLLLLFSAYKCGKLLFPSNKLLSLALPLTIIFHPQLVFLHSYSNNDALACALASMLTYLGLEIILNGLNLRRSILIGCLTGWLVLSKYSGLSIIPAIVLSIVLAGLLHEIPIALTILYGLVITLIATGISAWWFYRNGQQYSGDYLGTRTMYNSWATTFHRDMHYYLPPAHIIKDLRWWRMVFFSFWGLFGYMNKYLWRPVYFIYFGYFIVASCGWLMGLIQSWKKKLSLLDQQRKKNVAAWIFLVIIVLSNLGSMIMASVYNLGGPQGRYLFISELPIQALLLAGMSWFGRKTQKWLVISFLIFNATVCGVSWIWLFNLYHGWHLQVF